MAAEVRRAEPVVLNVDLLLDREMIPYRVAATADLREAPRPF
jgi:hypothetical protein